MVYLICFAISVFFAYLAKRAGDRTTFFVCSVLSLFITIMLAALRDFSIGYDTVHYQQRDIYWQGAISMGSIGAYLKHYLQSGNSEPLFALLMGCTAQFTDNYRVFLFLAQTIIMVGVYVGAFRMKEHSDPVLTLLLFYLIYYNYTLNTMRQYMSLAVLFAALHDIEVGKYKRYIVFVVIATLIHNISILGLPLLVLYYMLYGRTKAARGNAPALPKKVSLAKRILIGGLIIGVYCSFRPAVLMLIRAGILNSKYMIYLQVGSDASFLATRLFLLLEMVGIFITLRSFRKNNVRPDFFIYCSLAYFLLFQLSTVVRIGSRIARFFSCVNLNTLGMLVRSQRGTKKFLMCVLVIFIALVYWLYTYAYTNYSYTFPYILGV